jgi:hypothetical protein
MTAKKYLETRKRAMPDFDLINMIISELYELRDDKEMTQIYFERILQSDKRYEEWKKEHEKWSDALAEYGQIGFELEDGTVEYIDTKFRLNDGEFGVTYAEIIREELLKVIRADKSFGHLFNLLSKDKDSFITQQEIETAIREQEEALAEEAIPTGKTVNKSNKITPFENLLNGNEEIRSGLIEYLKQSFVGKGGKGKLFAIMVCALEKEGLITITDFAILYRSIVNTFGDIGTLRNFQKFLTKNELSTKLRETHYTNKLKHSEIDEHAYTIKIKKGELKSS